MDTLHKTLSYRQKRAVEIWITDGRKSKAQALRKAGFSEAVARVPSKVFDSPAVQQELELRGLGRDGLSNCAPPRAEMTEVVPITPPHYDFDPNDIPEEQIQALKARMGEVGYAPTPRQQIELPSFTPRGGFAFEEEPENRETQYRSMSSM